MAFVPANIPRSTKSGTDPFAYYVRETFKKKSDGSRGAAKHYLYFRITLAIAKRAGLKKGDGIRLDIDHAIGQARLVNVEHSSRHLSQTHKSQWSLYLSFPYTGDVKKILPRVATITGLPVLDASASEGIIFEIPPRKS